MLLSEWKDEKETLHLISQILGKYKLEAMYQEPQWSHVPLDITIQGFSTGMLHYENKDFLLEVNLIEHCIEIRVNDYKECIRLKNGTTIQSYFNQIKNVLSLNGINIKINTRPQEVEDITLLDNDIHHHHYREEISQKVLDLMKFAYHVESQFISPLRVRKFKPGLFWGTFDISCAMINSEHRPFEDDSKIIERAAFDEEMIEFGFWFGDNKFEGPTFFVLPYPFSDKQFECNYKFPKGSFFDAEMGEFLLELSDENIKNENQISEFFFESYVILKEYLGWGDCGHFHLPLKMNNNELSN